jgi:hypothetical protein
MRRALRAVLVLALGLVLLAPAATSAQAGPYCGIYWGSLAKSVPTLSSASVTGVRTGQHECYDRLVIDVRGKVRGYSVSYVDQFTAEGSGAVVPLRGGARLSVTAHVPAYSTSYLPTYSPRNARELSAVSGYQTFRQVAYGGSFEGYTSVGLGVRARLPFRVFVLDGPGSGSRLVVDVAHHW